MRFLKGPRNHSNRPPVPFGQGAANLAPRLIAARGYEPLQSASIAMWDGSQWQPIATSLTGFTGGTEYSFVSNLTSWDPDGDGPQAPLLIANGNFAEIDGVSASNVAAWDGAQWRPLGKGVPSNGLTLAVFDPDGSGPLPGELINSSTSGTSRWTGSTWEMMGKTGNFSGLATWDPDGSGPEPGALLGSRNSGSSRQVFRWDGATWQPLAGLFNRTLRDLIAWDVDGDGPAQARPVVVGDFGAIDGSPVHGIAQWDGVSWQPLDGGLEGDSTSGVALAINDPDGAGPRIAELIVAGTFEEAGGGVVNNIARHDETAWRAFGAPAIDNGVVASTTWDPDGPGPLEPQLVIGGSFVRIGDVVCNHVARWDGAAWQPLGAGMNDAVASLTSWDPDGDGPLNAVLVAGGGFSTAGGTAAARIAMWDGVAWSPIGLGFRGAVPNQGDVNALTVWDSDGSGPLPAQLIAGGNFTRSGSTTVNHIARWDGSAWRPLAGGVSGAFVPIVQALTTWDSDGDGPLGADLIVAGSFLAAGEVDEDINNIARWDGEWHTLGSGVDGPVNALTTWDPDGGGPEASRLIVGGFFGTAGGQPAIRVAQFDGASWQAMSLGDEVDSQHAVNALITHDVDGAGPQPARVVVGGANIDLDNSIFVWNGAGWDALEPDGTPGVISSLTRWSPQGSGSEQLIMTGAFDSAGSTLAKSVVMWNTLAAEILAQPEPTEVAAGANALFGVIASDVPNLTFQWRRDGVDLADGPTGAGSTITGARSPALSIFDVVAADTGAYDVVISNGCGDIVSTLAALAVSGAKCITDWDANGVVNSTDVSSFINDWFADQANGTLNADWNADGVSNSTDVSDFINAWFADMATPCGG